MNGLSWLIYIAGIVESLGELFFAFGFISTAIIAIGCIICICAYAESEDEDALVFAKKFFKWIWLPILFFFFSVAIPSTNTVYMIAASEMGETVITNPQSQEIFNDLKDIINLQLDSFKSDLTKE